MKKGSANAPTPTVPPLPKGGGNDSKQTVKSESDDTAKFIPKPYSPKIGSFSDFSVSPEYANAVTVSGGKVTAKVPATFNANFLENASYYPTAQNGGLLSLSTPTITATIKERTFPENLIFPVADYRDIADIKAAGGVLFRSKGQLFANIPDAKTVSTINKQAQVPTLYSDNDLVANNIWRMIQLIRAAGLRGGYGSELYQVRDYVTHFDTTTFKRPCFVPAALALNYAPKAYNPNVVKLWEAFEGANKGDGLFNKWYLESVQPAFVNGATLEFTLESYMNLLLDIWDCVYWHLVHRHGAKAMVWGAALQRMGAGFGFDWVIPYIAQQITTDTESVWEKVDTDMAEQPFVRYAPFYFSSIQFERPTAWESFAYAANKILKFVGDAFLIGIKAIAVVAQIVGPVVATVMTGGLAAPSLGALGSVPETVNNLFGKQINSFAQDAMNMGKLLSSPEKTADDFNNVLRGTMEGFVSNGLTGAGFE